MGTCKDCGHWKNKEKHWAGFFVGTCNKEPFDVRDMKADEMAVVCGHDGSVSVGENFGCIHFEKIGKDIT